MEILWINEKKEEKVQDEINSIMEELSAIWISDHQNPINVHGKQIELLMN